MRRLLLAISLIGLSLLAAPQPAHAYDIYHGVDCSQTAGAGSTVCADEGSNNNPLTGCDAAGTNSECGDGLLMKVTDIVAYIAGAAAVILIIVGAIRYITSGSDVSVGSRIDDDVLHAKNTIINALVGLVIIVLAKTIINYVIKRIH